MDEASDSLRVQVLDKMAALITAAFGLVAALAWNDAIKAFMAVYFESGEGVRALAAYAALVTVIAVLASLWVARALNRAKRVAARKAKRQEEREAKAQSQAKQDRSK